MNISDAKMGQTIRLTKTIEGVVDGVAPNTVFLAGKGPFTNSFGWEVELVKDAPMESGWYFFARKATGDFYGTYYINEEGMIGTNPQATFHDVEDWFWDGWMNELTMTRISQS